MFKKGATALMGSVSFFTALYSIYVICLCLSKELIVNASIPVSLVS